MTLSVLQQHIRLVYAGSWMLFVMKTVLDYENVCLERKYPELRYQVEGIGTACCWIKSPDRKSRNESGQMRPVCKLILKNIVPTISGGTAV